MVIQPPGYDPHMSWEEANHGDVLGVHDGVDRERLTPVECCQDRSVYVTSLVILGVMQVNVEAFIQGKGTLHQCLLSGQPGGE